MSIRQAISQRWRDLLSRIPLAPFTAILLVCLLLAAVVVFYLPYPDAAPWLFCYLTLLSLGTTLLSSKWQLQRTPHKYVNGLANMVSFLTLQSAFYMGAIAFHYLRFDSPTLVSYNLLISAILLMLFSYLRGRPGTSLYRVLSHPISVALQFIAVSVIGLVVIILVRHPYRYYGPEEMARHRPAVPWQRQLSVAQAEAAKLSKDAVLEGITATPVFVAKPDYTTTLSVVFDFITPDGETFMVTLEDTDPENTAWSISTTNADDQGNRVERQKPTPQQLEMLRSAIATVRLSPREALLRTISEVSPPVEQDGDSWTQPRIMLHLAGWVTQAPPEAQGNLPAVWEVNHAIRLGEDHRHFWLDPSTGRIVNRTSDNR